jgi:RNA polymerase sigma-54 factor
MANPVLEEVAEEGTAAESYTDEAFLKKETEKLPETPAANPFDEFDFGSFFGQYLDTGSERVASGEHEEIEKPSFDKFLSSPASLTDYLMWQLSVSISSEEVRKMEDVEEALTMVQEFDPPGVAARDLQECLLIQLKVVDPQNTLAQQIITDHLKLLQNNQMKEVARTLNRPIELVKRAVDVIKRLDPKPGLRYNKTEPRLVEPDVQFRKVDGEWQVFINDDDLPQLRLSPTYRRLLARDAADRDVRSYVKERFTAAIQLMKNIEQRKHTIVRVCNSILRRQADYLDYGPDHLKPMMIKEVAEEVGVHPSTVSRAVANKYVHTPQGVLELRTFFSESVNGPQGSEMSLSSLKRRVKQMIEEEDTSRPLTDEQITKKLSDEGIHVTRRTVAKYREDLRIPSTHRRRVKV